MSEKTAEEKLRQALEGSTTSTNEHELPKDNKKPRPSRARPKSSPRTVKSENLGERLDSFMDDFERRIEESLNAVKSPSESHEHHETPRRVKISAEPKPETSRRVRARPKANLKPLEELIPSQPESSPEISHVKTEAAPETQPVPESVPVIEPEPVQEISQPETESVPEIEPVPESLPIIEPEPVQETSHPETESVPEIEPIQEELPVSEPEPLPETLQPETESVPETQPVPESFPVSQPEPVPEISPAETESAPEIQPLPESLPISEPEPVQEISPAETESLPEVESVQEDLPISEPEPVRETSQPKTESAPEVETVPEILPVIEPEPLQETSQPETESVPEIQPIQEDLPVSEPEPVQETSHPETESLPEIQPVPESLPVIESEPVQETSQPETESVPEIQPIQEDLPVIESEPIQEISHPETEPTQEEIIPDVIPVDEEYEPEPELPDIPVIEADFNSVPDTTQEIFGGLPEIPVISPDDDIDDTAEIFTDGLEDIITPDETETSPHEDETETRREPQIDFQEAELLEAPDNEDDFADIDTEDNTDAFTDEPLDEEPAAPNSEETEYDTHGDFSPAADVVLNVDDEIPRITPPPEAETDPESESVPVTVTMPESTKTAEDKLMADIAEAMTGNPLTLDSLEQPGLYNLPENFFTDNSNPDSPQSAEDKLKANIAQALSESPINTAQDQANQSLEHDINPFDELSENETHDEELPTEESNDDDLLPETNDDLLPQETHDEVLPQETNDDDLFPKENHDEPEESLTDFDAMTEDNTTPNDDEIPNDPFTIPDLGDDDNTANLEASDDETRFFADAFTDDSDENASDLGIIPKTDPDNPPEATLIPEIYSEPEHSAEPDTLTTPEILPESEPELTPEISAEPKPEPKPESSSDDDDMPFPVNDEPENVPLTEQEALIAMVNQQFETENTHKEAEPENNMPEQSLLNDETPDTIETENNDDWDISSLGELGQVATLADDNEDFTTSPGTVTEMITQPEPTVPHNPEEDHKEKTMSIREKLALRKNKNSDGKSSGNSKSGFLMPLLVLALAVIGGLILWQLMQLSDKITSMAMNAQGYESVSGAEPPSYEYAIDFILDPNLSDRMSQRGRAGWQVVGSRRTQDSTTGQYGYEFIFMRRTPGR